MTSLRVLLSRVRGFRGRGEARLTQETETRLDQRRLPALEALAQDLRVGVRLLARDRGFTATAVLVLGLGIGVNNMFFTLVYGHTLRGLPIDHAERILYISMLDAQGGDRGLTYAEFDDLRGAARSFAGIAAFINTSMSVGDRARAPDRFEGAYVSADAFAVIGITLVLGRTFAAGDDRPGAAPVAMLSHHAWQVRYSGDSGILGRSILIDGSPATVIGVTPDRSGFPSTADVWQPLSMMPGLGDSSREVRTLRVLGRVRDGVAPADARAEVESIVSRTSRAHSKAGGGPRARVVPVNERYFGRLTHPAWLAFMTAGCLIVIVSCANVANLMLARAVHRAREIAIRSSLGAGRRRIVRQLMVECAVLATLGAVAGLGLAFAGVQVFRTAIPENVLPYWVNYSIDARVVAALVMVSVVAVFAFGLVPSVHASRMDVSRILKDGGRVGAGGCSARGWSTAFLTAELAVAVVLLAQLALSLRLERAALPTDRAIDTRDVLTAAITLPGDKYRSPEQRIDFYRRIDERVGSLAGVSLATLASHMPLSGATERRLDVAGRPRGAGDAMPSVWTVAIGPRYFETLGVPLLRGRTFAASDGAAGAEGAIVNERLAQMFFGEENPMGRRIALVAPTSPEPEPAWLTIIGVSPTIRQRPLPDPDPVVYLPYRFAPPATAALLVRSRSDPGATVTLLRDAVLGLDPDLPLYRTMTLAQVVDEALWNQRVSSRLVYFLTAIALGLSTVGLYAVTSHAVGQRTREIGLRMALGARPRHVRRLVIRRAAVQLALGLTAGILCNLAWDRMFSVGDRALLSPMDPLPLMMVSAVVVLVAGVACLMPVRRAVRMDPVAALRQE